MGSTATKTRYSMGNHHLFSVLKWNIRFVSTQQLCGCVGLNSHTITIFHCKTPFFSVLGWIIQFVWVLSRIQQPHKNENTIFYPKTLFFYRFIISIPKHIFFSGVFFFLCFAMEYKIFDSTHNFLD